MHRNMFLRGSLSLNSPSSDGTDQVNSPVLNVGEHKRFVPPVINSSMSILADLPPLEEKKQQPRCSSSAIHPVNPPPPAVAPIPVVEEKKQPIAILLNRLAAVPEVCNDDCFLYNVANCNNCIMARAIDSILMALRSRVLNHPLQRYYGIRFVFGRTDKVIGVFPAKLVARLLKALPYTSKAKLMRELTTMIDIRLGDGTRDNLYFFGSANVAERMSEVSEHLNEEMFEDVESVDMF